MDVVVDIPRTVVISTWPGVYELGSPARCRRPVVSVSVCGGMWQAACDPGHHPAHISRKSSRISHYTQQGALSEGSSSRKGGGGGGVRNEAGVKRQVEWHLPLTDKFSAFRSISMYDLCMTYASDVILYGQ